MNYIFWFWLPPVGYMAAIFLMSALPHPEVVVGREIPDYILHALEYFLLALLIMRLLLARPTPILKKHKSDLTIWHQLCWLGVVISIIYGMTDEFHQYFVPNRQCTLSDWLADACGALLAYGVAALDYFLLNHSRSWMKFWQRFEMAATVSYAAYRLNAK